MKCLSEIRQNNSVMHYILALFMFIKYTSYPMVLAFSFRKYTKVLGYSAVCYINEKIIKISCFLDACFV